MCPEQRSLRRAPRPFRSAARGTRSEQPELLRAIRHSAADHPALRPQRPDRQRPGRRRKHLHRPDNCKHDQQETMSGDAGSSGIYPIYPTGVVAACAATRPQTRPSYRPLAQQSYGATAISASESLGENPASLAAIAKVELNFQNVSHGERQLFCDRGVSVHQGHFCGRLEQQRARLHGRRLDRPERPGGGRALLPAANREHDFGLDRSARDDPPGLWRLGIRTGCRSADRDAQLTARRSARSFRRRALANNGMTTWTVGDFRQTMGTRLGAAANQTVMTGTGA